VECVPRHFCFWVLIAKKATNAPSGGLDASGANINAKKPEKYGAVTPRPDGPKPVSIVFWHVKIQILMTVKEIIYPPPGTIVDPAPPITTGSRYQIQSQILNTRLEFSEISLELAWLGQWGTARLAFPGTSF
jgi:hypothetical protein